MERILTLSGSALDSAHGQGSRALLQWLNEIGFTAMDLGGFGGNNDG